MGKDSWNFVGHTVRADELELIRSILDEVGGLSLVELASTVCELLGWTRATGRLKARECGDLLERLEAAGEIRLPAKRVGRPRGARTRVPVTRGDMPAPVTGTVHDLAPIGLERVTTPEDRLLFRNWWGAIITWATRPRSGPFPLLDPRRASRAAGRRLRAVLECG